MLTRIANRTNLGNRNSMKILIRHAKPVSFSYPSKNCSQRIPDSAFPALQSLRDLILMDFTDPLPIFTSRTDRAIETAIMLCPDGLEILQECRRMIEEAVAMSGKSAVSFNAYCDFQIPLPPNITVNLDLYNCLPESIQLLDRFIAVTHHDVIEGVNGERLDYGKLTHIH